VQIKPIREKLEFDFPSRMLQRRLALLVKQKQLIVDGRGRGNRYRWLSGNVIINVPTGELRSTGHVPQVEVYPPISPKGEEIKNAVCDPIQYRKPVGYNQGFLRKYRPNETFYLPAKTRQHLLDIRRSSDSQRPAGTYVRQIFNRLLIDLSWNSSRLKGNTYSLLETDRLLELGKAAEGKDILEAQMILNHKAAIEWLVEEATEIGFNPHTILNLHALLSDNLLPDPQACGRLRAIVD